MTSHDLADVVRSLGQRLQDAVDLEDGGAALLEALCGTLARGLGASEPVVRGSVHLRSDGGGYRALVLRELGSAPDALEAATLAPSTTVWSCVVAHGGVAIDLATNMGLRLADGAAVRLGAAYVAPTLAAGVAQMLERETTHLVALPIRIGGAGPAGMVSLEVAWPHASDPFTEGSWRGDLAVLCDLASPHIASLPLAASRETAETFDPLLPVLGERTRPLLSVLRVFVDQDETLLITGPTGAGKSRLADWCHQRSRRREGPFETANLLAVPESMQMAELFGWKKGAFTGAHADHDGLVATAEGGTLFLDEIDKLTLAAQAGLLRVLETRRFAPLGASRERRADVRFVVATNADLRALVRRGAFREDLYYRIHVLPVHLPGLDERTDEIGAWADEMLRRRAPEGRARFSDAARAALRQARWPGNLRQLENVVRRAYALHLATGADGPEVRVETVQRSLSVEAPTAARTFSDAEALAGLTELAALLVERAIDARRLDRTISLEELDVFRGAVLRAAVERLGNVKDAFLLFGADKLVQSRNHAAAYRRELALLEALEQRLSRGE